MESDTLSCFWKNTPRNKVWKCKKHVIFRYSFRCIKSHFSKGLFWWITMIHWSPRYPIWGQEWSNINTPLFYTNVRLTWDSLKLMFFTSFCALNEDFVGIFEWFCIDFCIKKVFFALEILDKRKKKTKSPQHVENNIIFCWILRIDS